jgi:hypothetical protein
MSAFTPYDLLTVLYGKPGGMKPQGVIDGKRATRPTPATPPTLLERVNRRIAQQWRCSCGRVH